MRTWLQGTLLLLVTLSTGVALGVTYERRRTPASTYPALDSRHLMERFGRDLELSNAQRAAIDTILLHRQRGVDARWREMQPHVRATLDSTFQEISRVLTPEQAAKFRAMVEAAHATGNPHADSNHGVGSGRH